MTAGAAARLRRIACAVLLLWFTLAPETARADLSEICDHAAVQAAKATGVPISVLKAISLNETGRKRDGAFRPWPWTVNMEGKGAWFETEDEARAFVYDHFKRGAVSFDVGCFQINYKWHHEAFTSIEQMFEPLANALYAAEFLQSLYAEKGTWSGAAGAYHSRNAKYADKYTARFETFRAKFLAEDGVPLPDVPDTVLAAATEGVDVEQRREVIRINTYPLLQAGGTGQLGSLVPLGAASGRSLVSGQEQNPPDEPAPDEQGEDLALASDEGPPPAEAVHSGSSGIGLGALY